MTHMNAAPPPPGGAESDFDRRIALATPEDTARGLFFNGLLHAVTNLGGDPALKRCLSIVNDKRFERRFIDFSSYPVTDFLRMARAATQVLSAQLGGPEPTLRRLGMQATRDFTASMAGRTLLLLSGNSPQRVMNGLITAYRSAVSYGERSVTMTGEKSARLVVKRDFMLPLYNEGVLLALLEAIHARRPLVRTRPTGLLDCEYELSWE